MNKISPGIKKYLDQNRRAADMSELLTSVGVVGLLLISGVWYFRKMERTFADVI